MKIIVESAWVLLLGLALGLGLGLSRGFAKVPRASTDSMCATPVPKQPDVHWITQREASQLVNDPNVLFVDARPKEKYERAHITGALSVPYVTSNISFSEPLMAVFKKAHRIITYCDTNDNCAVSRTLAQALAEKGLSDVSVLEGGIPTWLNEGYAAESGVCSKCP